MKLSKLYTNQNSIFSPVRFRDGLNVILGEIRRPENRDKDTHNLGKTTLSQVIDFCLLKKLNKSFFLLKYEHLFTEIIFFLEIKLHNNSYITIRRSVESSSKASFMRHSHPNQDFTMSGEAAWQHWEVAFDRSKELLDGYLNLNEIAPWTFRHAVGYSLRSQKDYDSPFKLAKYGGKDVKWKPLLAHILGLNSELVKKNYNLAEKIKELESEEKRLRTELAGLDDLDQLRGLVEIKQREMGSLEHDIERYNFQIADSEINRELIESIDRSAADMNEERYYLMTRQERIEEAMAERVIVDLNKIRRTFEQAKVYFGEQITKDYEALEAFNKAISEERDEYLQNELQDISGRLKIISPDLESLNQRRSTALLALKDKETFSKFKRLNKHLVGKQADLEILKRQRDAVEKIKKLQRKVRDLSNERDHVQDEIRDNVQQATGRYEKIRNSFDDVIKSVINKNANLYTTVNQEGNMEFHADIVDEKGRKTSESEGYSYGRLLCTAFDIAVLSAYADDAYPSFVYLDGVLESFEPRKKLLLLKIIQEYCESGTQHIITVLDSELPHLDEGTVFSFDDDEIILRLHDEGKEGRLFKMETW